MSSAALFDDRRDAGRQLAAVLTSLEPENPVILGIPRGGIPVAAEVAAALNAPLDVVVVRKVGAPWNPEYAIGAVGESHSAVMDEHLVRAMHVPRRDIERLTQLCSDEVVRRTQTYRREHPQVPLAGRTVILIDDGLATGETARAALEIVRERNPRRIVVAAPVASRNAFDMLDELADRVVVLGIPEKFRYVAEYFDDFSEVSDADVQAILAEDRARNEPLAQTAEVAFRADGVMLPGTCHLPAHPKGLIIFAHASGSDHMNPRDIAIADHLNRRGFGTLRFDLVTRIEKGSKKGIDIDVLARRMRAATTWARSWSEKQLPIGFFGSSTGAAAALVAAAASPGTIAAIVCGDGSPALAEAALGNVSAPTLLIVGAQDTDVVAENRNAMNQLGCQTRLEVVPGAGHLFSEPGALDRVASLAGDWFDVSFEDAWAGRGRVSARKTSDFDNDIRLPAQRAGIDAAQRADVLVLPSAGHDHMG